MTEPSVTLMWAMAENGVIGCDGRLPWHLPDELRRFKAMTSGHSIIMGRSTWESLPRRPLPDRHNIVLTRAADYVADGATIARSLDSAIEAVVGDTTFVIGGASVYSAALPIADRLEVTIVHAEIDGDTEMPPIDWAEWRLVSEEPNDADADHEYRFTYRSYERCRPQGSDPDDTPSRHPAAERT